MTIRRLEQAGLEGSAEWEALGGIGGMGGIGGIAGIGGIPVPEIVCSGFHATTRPLVSKQFRPLTGPIQFPPLTAQALPPEM